MARISAPWEAEGELASPVQADVSKAGTRTSAIEQDIDPRLLDLEVEEESPFLRVQKRVPVRRGALPRKAANRLKLVLVLMAAFAVAGGITLMLYRYGTHSWRFRLSSSDNLTIAGNSHVTRAQVLDVLAGDIGRNVFFIPLGDRKKQLQEIPWVESATVMRLLPSRVRIEIRERVPVAFAQIGSRVALIDANGVVMELPPGAIKKYSFPVIVGMGVSEPLSTRAARMKIFTQLMSELDGAGAHYEKDINEVDLSDPEDVKVTVNDPRGEVFIHLGSSNFLSRYQIFMAHIREWRQQFQKVSSVDLRYEQQVIVNPDEGARPRARAARLPAKANVPAKRKARH